MIYESLTDITIFLLIVFMRMLFLQYIATILSSTLYQSRPKHVCCTFNVCPIQNTLKLNRKFVKKRRDCITYKSIANIILSMIFWCIVYLLLGRRELLASS